MLHAQRRIHAVRLPPRPGLPLGLLMLSVYAPLPGHAQQLQRSQFNSALLDLTCSLDLQQPTLLLGDFNGSILPDRDFPGGRRSPCPLLSQLLGPSGAWTDLHAALVDPPLQPTYRSSDATGRSGSSRIDLILASRSALPLIQRVEVLSHISDGGHSPVVATLHLRGPLAIDWRRPRPALPPLLQQPSTILLHSAEWAALLDRWCSSPIVHSALEPSPSTSAAGLSRAIVASLQHLVSLAGGWSTRPPQRRSAYDSTDIRRARQKLRLLHQLETLLRPLSGPCTWPHQVILQLNTLQRLDVPLPGDSLPSLQSAIHVERLRLKSVVHALLRSMREVRCTRWRDSVAPLWRDRPGAVQRWLQDTGAAWGTTPILDSAGQQCTTHSAVDAAVSAFWVHTVFRQHAHVDEEAAWARFLASPFGACIPTATWPHTPWDAPRVQHTLRCMKERASPGDLGIPIAVWRSLPPAFHASLAQLLNLVESSGTWPAEWLNAYIAMIPKSSGGSRPQDQRPITVLDVLYRCWSKGVIAEWAAVLQRDFLGQSAMGFRAGAGTLHLAQLLADLIVLQRRRGAQLWLASFDIVKCFDSLPWWALFGTLRHAGVPSAIVDCFKSFYSQLLRRFRYGQVDGDVWRATNGLAQGCPASPDLLNILFEAFHRWAAAAGFGVSVAGHRIASASFADDLALVAGSLAEMQQLIGAYLEWCSLLGVKVTKVQVWSSLGPGRAVAVSSDTILTVPQFRIVGVMLGSDEAAATSAHFQPRLAKAIATAQRLQALQVPASITAQLWRTTVLPQALYGCEIRDVSPAALRPLLSAGLTAICSKHPLALNIWRAVELVTCGPLGDTSLRDPEHEARSRQLHWLHLLANLPGLVGSVHRAVAWHRRQWLEPSPALQSALNALGWSVQRNPACLRSSAWPHLSPEHSYPAPILLEPADSAPPQDATFTDGSVCSQGGAAAICPSTGAQVTATVSAPRSSTHCELIALILALQQRSSVVLTDSLTSLQLIRNWATWPPARVLRCPDRAEVRQLLHIAQQRPAPPTLEKVKAHNTSAVAAGDPKAIGNDLADQLARAAALGASHPLWDPPSDAFHDPVQLLDSQGSPISDVANAFQDAWWSGRHAAVLRRRPALALYPSASAISWPIFCRIFRRPTVPGNSFQHSAPPPVIKWIARIRTGALAPRERLHRRGMVTSPACPCCNDPQEDDLHILTGCPATGTVDWPSILQECWISAASSIHLDTPPPVPWLADNHLPLLAALLPLSLFTQLTVDPPTAQQFAARFHLALATATAERLRRREAIIADAPHQPVAASGPAQHQPCPLPPERQLSPRALRLHELQRRSSHLAAPSPSAAMPPPPPPDGDHRRRWLRMRLLEVLDAEATPCPAADGATAEQLVELFERITGEPFTDTPGAPLTSRIRALAKVMGNLTRDGAGHPPLTTCRHHSLMHWSRLPRNPVDTTAWRRSTETAEQFSTRPLSSRRRMAAADSDLARWIRTHPHLTPAEPALGESGMALLILWEVDHQQPFPTQAPAHDLPALLKGFTRRLKQRIAGDDELSRWFTSEVLQRPLAPGLADTHHTRWSVRLVPPGPDQPRGWYDAFVSRWRTYLATQAQPTGQQLLPSPALQTPPPVLPQDEATSSSALLPLAQHLAASPDAAPPGPLQAHSAPPRHQP